VTIKQQVQYQLIRIHMSHLIAVMAGNLWAALLVVISSWAIRDHSFLLLWFAIDVAAASIVLLAAHMFRKGETNHSSTVWLRVLMLCWLLFGLIWGVPASLFIDVSDAYSFVILSCLTIGVLTSPLYSLSILPPLYYIFLGAIITQYGLMLIRDHTYILLMLALLSILIFLVWLSNQIFRLVYDLHYVRIENAAYMDKLEQAKIDAEQANIAKTRFLASASHDLRQPLQAMALYAETLAHRLNDKKNIETMESLRISHGSMSRIMESLLDISKLDAGIVDVSISTVNLGILINHIIDEFQMMAERKGIVIRRRVNDLFVRSDIALVERIVSNLLSNAIRYTESGGVLVTCRYKNGQVLVDVWDTGTGIAEDQQDEIFFEFHQLGNPERDREKGLGLGLAIVRRLICLLDGHHIELCSRPGHGSRFRLVLPKEDAMSMTVDPQQTVLMPVEQLGDLRVLLIEDDVSVRQAMVAFIQEWGCDVVGVDSIFDAVSSVTQGWVPDAIIADYRLPDEQTGIQVIAAVREQIKQNIPALIVSGESLPETLQNIRQADVLMLHKPVVPAKLKLFLKQCSKPVT